MHRQCQTRALSSVPPPGNHGKSGKRIMGHNGLLASAEGPTPIASLSTTCWCSATMPCTPLLPELLDHIVDFLHDSSDALKSCCLVSKLWAPRTRMHLFACIRFYTAKDLEACRRSRGNRRGFLTIHVFSRHALRGGNRRKEIRACPVPRFLASIEVSTFSLPTSLTQKNSNSSAHFLFSRTSPCTRRTLLDERRLWLR